MSLQEAENDAALDSDKLIERLAYYADGYKTYDGSGLVCPDGLLRETITFLRAQQTANARLQEALQETPINVYCKTPAGKQLVAALSNVTDVPLFNAQYCDIITWNMDVRWILKKTDAEAACT